MESVYFKLDERTSSVDEMKLNELKNLLGEFGNNVSLRVDLKKIVLS